MTITVLKNKSLFIVVVLEIGQIQRKEIDLLVGFVCKLLEGVKIFSIVPWFHRIADKINMPKLLQEKSPSVQQ